MNLWWTALGFLLLIMESLNMSKATTELEKHQHWYHSIVLMGICFVLASAARIEDKLRNK